jgi:hypothetical protein
MATPPLPSDDPPLSTMTMLTLYDYLCDHNAIIYRACEVAVPGCLALRHLQEVHRLVAQDHYL